MSIDEKLYQMPIVGPAYVRMHAYFRKNVTITDLLHVLMGIGLGLMFASNDYFYIGIPVLILALVYHVYAYTKGKGIENSKL